MGEGSHVLSAWNSFYVMIGSSSAALTGLMFVVITLVDDRRRASEEGISTFSTPTVVHFSFALFTSALMSAPFQSLVPIAIILGLAGAGGVLYVVRVALRTSKLSTYRPDPEDWTCNVLIPFVAYATLVTGSFAMQTMPSQALYAPATTVMFLVFVGIHNAWDVVTFLASGKAEVSVHTADADADAPSH